MHPSSSIANLLPGFQQSSYLDRNFVKDNAAVGRQNSAMEAVSFSHSSSVDVSISSQGMQLSYQSQTSFSYISTSVESVSRPAPAESMHTPELSAENILNFIGQHVQKLADEGASSEELESALQHGLQGFEKGRDEAIDILEGYGLYEGPIKEGVAKTTELVESGIDEIRDRLIGGSSEDDVEVEVVAKDSLPTNPTPAPAVVTDSVKNDVVVEKSAEKSESQSPAVARSGHSVVASYRERFSSSESVDLTVQTLDGDIITVNLEAFQEYQRQFEMGAQYGRGEHGRGERFSVSLVDGQSSSYNANFNYSVEGELDEGELAALQDLFSQVNELATSFFSGDLASALEKALSLNMDVGELASMSLNMSQSMVMEAESTYRKVSDMGDGDRRHQGIGHGHHHGLHGLGKHSQGLLDMLKAAEAFSSPKDLVSELFAATFAKLDSESDTDNRGEALQKANDILLNAVEKQYEATVT